MTHPAPRNRFATGWNDHPSDPRPMIDGPHPWRRSTLSHRRGERHLDSSRARLTFGKYRGCHVDDVPTRYLAWALREVAMLDSERFVVEYQLRRRHGISWEGGRNR